MPRPSFDFSSSSGGRPVRPARCVGRGLLLLLLALYPAQARADWLLIPFVAGALGSRTTFIDLERSPSATRPLFGVSGSWLSDGLIGVEGSVAYGPAFFQRRNTLLTGSHLSTASGTVLIAVPLAVTRESLRPYVAGGLATINIGLEDVAGLFTQSRTMAALVVGGGAVGFVSRRTGVRFDLRQVRSLDRVSSPLTGETQTPLSFWQASLGLVLRY